MAADTRQIAEKLHALKAAYDQQLGPRIGALESALAEIAAAGDAVEDSDEKTPRTEKQQLCRCDAIECVTMKS